MTWIFEIESYGNMIQKKMAFDVGHHAKFPPPFIYYSETSGPSALGLILSTQREPSGLLELHPSGES